RLDRIIRHWHDGLERDPRQLQELEELRAAWVRQLNPGEHPRGPLPPPAWEALWARARAAREGGDPEAALSCAWAAFQQCPAGTVAFQRTLCELVECAAEAGDDELAIGAASFLLAHHSLLRMGWYDPRTPVGTRE